MKERRADAWNSF